MEKDPAYYHDLLSAYIDNRLDIAQVEELLAFIGQEPGQYRSLLDSASIREQLMVQATDEGIAVPDVVSERVLGRLLPVIGGVTAGDAVPIGNIMPAGDKKVITGNVPGLVVHRIHFLRRSWLWYAAAAIILLGIGVFIWKKNKQGAETAVNHPVYPPADILPGGNKATLTLANGQVITLDSAADGALAKEGNTNIVKLSNGQVSYTAATNSRLLAEATYNTMTTPRGGQYQLTLPDGTKVWLNAASSLTYPTAFTGKERKVTLRGEAYFEVSSDKARPFKVVIGKGAEIEVLGTHFNINAYPDEPDARTTLLEGSVKVSQVDQSLLLRPGQQALLVETRVGGGPVGSADRSLHVADHSLSMADNPDLAQVMAWKNGSFLFDRTSLDVVMRQLSRWYDVDVVYEKGIPAVRFAGEMKRDLNLSEVLAILHKMEVHCHIEGKKLIVTP